MIQVASKEANRRQAVIDAIMAKRKAWKEMKLYEKYWLQKSQGVDNIFKISDEIKRLSEEIISADYAMKDFKEVFVDHKLRKVEDDLNDDGVPDDEGCLSSMGQTAAATAAGKIVNGVFMTKEQIAEIVQKRINAYFEEWDLLHEVNGGLDK